jgi:hypothetical protein
MEDQKDKGLNGDRLHSQSGDQSGPLRAPTAQRPVIPIPREADWQRYCDCRLKHFASGR